MPSPPAHSSFLLSYLALYYCGVFKITSVSPEYFFLLPNRVCKKKKTQRQIKVFLKASCQCKKKKKKIIHLVKTPLTLLELLYVIGAVSFSKVLLSGYSSWYI